MVRAAQPRRKVRKICVKFVQLVVSDQLGRRVFRLCKLRLDVSKWQLSIKIKYNLLSNEWLPRK